MLKTKQISFQSPLLARLRLFGLVLALVGLIGSAAIVHADQFDEKINALNQQNNAARGVLNGLQAQAGSYQEAISQLQAQIDAMTAALNANLAKQAGLQQQITDNQTKIDQNRAYLKESIKTMYVDGQLSAVEALATSRNLSDYVDKEEYRTSVQNKIDSMVKEITAQQEQLKKQKAELDVLVSTQKQQNDQLASARSQQQQLLSYNQGQQDAYNGQIASNNSQISELRRQQIAANSRFIGGAGTGAACGGGYPARWCEIAQDSVIDSWGMYNRECVSYTAFRVAASGRYMPYWGGIGNANQWDDNARAAGIPVDTNPQAGDVAISNRGFYGHAMYVESVNGDGTINISQYNAALDGRYSTRSHMDPSGLYFIHF